MGFPVTLKLRAWWGPTLSMFRMKSRGSQDSSWDPHRFLPLRQSYTVLGAVITKTEMNCSIERRGNHWRQETQKLWFSFCGLLVLPGLINTIATPSFWEKALCNRQELLEGTSRSQPQKPAHPAIWQTLFTALEHTGLHALIFIIIICINRLQPRYFPNPPHTMTQ